MHSFASSIQLAGRLREWQSSAFCHRLITLRHKLTP